ncbi:ssDNA-binding protein, mitochondrial [Arachnomyces sp. PD_36]|nr:ssDNA-binding protein, mitochondrial [Arachnomyces sp. PD_36]
MNSFTSLRPVLRAATNSTPSSFLARSAQRSSPFSSTAARDFSRLTIIGHLGATPELHTTQNGQELVRYKVAVNHGRNEKRQTSWFAVTHFIPSEGPRRDYMFSLQKGAQVCVEGDASIRSFEDVEGKKQYQLSVVQRTIEVLKRPSTGSNTEENEGYSPPSEENQ